MEHLPGLNLEQLGERHGTLPSGRVIYILAQVCASLSEAHEAGLIHRDIKAANVILCERGGRFDVAKVVDFGLVKPIEPDAADLDGGLVFGTPAYMPPEAIRTPSRVDARSDLFAVGVLGYVLLTARHPFGTQDVRTVLSRQLSGTPEAPSAAAPEPIDPDLEAIILRCLAMEPEMRPTSARTLRADLLACSSVGTWTAELGRRWWLEHEPELSGQAQSAGLPTELDAQFGTLGVDLADRLADPLAPTVKLEGE